MGQKWGMEHCTKKLTAWKILFTNIARDDSGYLPTCTVMTIHNEIGISLFNSLVDQVVVLSFVVLLVNKIRLPLVPP